VNAEKAYELSAAYGEWISQNDYDLAMCLRLKKTPSPLASSAAAEAARIALSKKVRELFGNAENVAFGKTKKGAYRRKLYKRNPKFHIHRVVSIELDEDGMGFHAHLLVKKLDGWSYKQMIELLYELWKELNNTATLTKGEFWGEPSENKRGSSVYITKDAHKQEALLVDGIDLWSSFISKP